MQENNQNFLNVRELLKEHKQRSATVYSESNRQKSASLYSEPFSQIYNKYPNFAEIIFQMLESGDAIDKLLRFFQYFVQLLSCYYENTDENLSHSYLKASKEINFLRRVTQLGSFIKFIPKALVVFKSFNHKVFKSQGKIVPISLFLSFACFSFQRFIDNLVILTRLKFIPFFKEQKLFKFGNSIWLIGIVISLIFHVGKLQKSFQKEYNIKNQILKKATTPLECQKQILRVSRERRAFIANIIRIVGDLIIAIDNLEWFSKFFRTTINKSLIGLSGVVGAAISLYSVFVNDILPSMGYTKKQIANKGFYLFHWKTSHIQ